MNKVINYITIFYAALCYNFAFAAYSNNTINESTQINGGLIKTSQDSTISDYFNNNSITSTGTSSDGNIDGGIIYNDNYNIDINNSTFNTNIINSNNQTRGGIIYNNESSQPTQVIISNTNFLNNNITSAQQTSGGIYGGIIYNNGNNYRNKFVLSNTNFLNNNINSDSNIGGGIIYNATSEMNILNSTFSNNTIQANGAVNGGVLTIFNASRATIIDSSFINNTSTSINGDVFSGALFNTDLSTATIISQNKDIVFSGNNINGNNTNNQIISNAIYNNDSSTVNLNSNSGRSIIFNDGIDGDSSLTSNININNSSALPSEYSSAVDSKGTVVFNNTVQNNNINLYGGTVQLGIAGTDSSNFVIPNTYFSNSPITVYGTTAISSQNGRIDNEINLSTLSFDTNYSGSDPLQLLLAVDVDLNAQTSDKFSASFGQNTNTPSVLVNSINILEYGDTDVSVVNMAMGGDLADVVEYNLPSNIYTPIYTYDVSFNDSTKDAIFSRQVNKSLLNQSVSIRALSNIQHDITRRMLSTDVNFKFDVSTERLVLSDRIKYRSDIIKNPNDSKAIRGRIYNLVRVDNESDAMRLLSGENVYGLLAYMVVDNGNSGGNGLALNKSGVWFDIIGNTQHKKYDHNFPTVDDEYFSVLLGLNTKTKKFSNGVRAYGNIYLGYLRGEQKYTGSKIQNDGGYVGASAIAEYKNFIFGLTANIGLADNDASNTYGKDNYDNYWLTLGAKFGYNWNIGKGYFLEPSIYLSYVLMNADGYHTKSGVKIREDNLNSFQISPTLKFSKIFRDSSALSLKVRYVAELANDLNLRADNVRIYELGNGNFVEYGISYDKIFTKSFSVNLELNRRDGDTQGWNGGVSARFLF